jgi:hypothetical protein
MNAIILKYPPGEFTQAELAEFNGMEKLAVYLPLKEAEAKGILVKTGTRPTGKRPANLYRIASNNATVPVPASLTPQPIVEPPQVPLAPLAPLAPVIQPVAEPPSAPNPSYLCPLCNGPMTEIPDVAGVTIKCFNPCDSQCHENVYGHGKNTKDAYEVAKQKYHL